MYSVKCLLQHSTCLTKVPQLILSANEPYDVLILSLFVVRVEVVQCALHGFPKGHCVNAGVLDPSDFISHSLPFFSYRLRVIGQTGDIFTEEHNSGRHHTLQLYQQHVDKTVMPIPQAACFDHVHTFSDTKKFTSKTGNAVAVRCGEVHSIHVWRVITRLREYSALLMASLMESSQVFLSCADAVKIVYLARLSVCSTTKLHGEDASGQI